VRLSLSITNYSWPGGAAGIVSGLGDVIRTADEGGLDTVWVADHVLQADPFAGDATEMLEAYTTLGFLAGLTRRVRLGTMVTGVTFRPPSLLVKAVTTLDVLTGGRAWLGVGAGYLEDEARAMDLPLPPAAERFERLRETLQLALQMWSGTDAAFTGQHYRLEHPVNSPNSVSRPHPPILVGGTGERKTLRLVAEYADACNVFDIPDGGQTVRRKLDVLARHCEAVGRSYDEIDKTLSTRLGPDESAEEFSRRCEGFAALGITHVVVIAGGPWTVGGVEILAGAVPALDQMDDHRGPTGTCDHPAV
jgi:F420-dependent oxidoreductase-like protein